VASSARSAAGRRGPAGAVGAREYAERLGIERYDQLVIALHDLALLSVTNEGADLVASPTPPRR